MSVVANWSCDECGAVEENAGLSGPTGWAMVDWEDLCASCYAVYRADQRQDQAAASERRGAEEGE